MHAKSLQSRLTLCDPMDCSSSEPPEIPEYIYSRCKRPEFDPWVKKFPWRRKWQPSPVFLPGEFQGQRSLTGYGCKVRQNWVTNSLLSYLIYVVCTFYIIFSFKIMWWVCSMLLKYLPQIYSTGYIFHNIVVVWLIDKVCIYWWKLKFSLIHWRNK